MKKKYIILRRITVIAILSIGLLLSSCNETVVVRGIEGFSTALDTKSLTRYMLPSEDFLESFSYESGDFYYYDYAVEHVKTIMYLQYTSSVYLRAKQYCFDNFCFGKVKSESYEGYTFVETLGVSQLNSCAESQFPQFFNLFAYNDNTCTLLFLGYYSMQDKYLIEREKAEYEFETFIDDVYSECFSAAEGK